MFDTLLRCYDSIFHLANEVRAPGDHTVVVQLRVARVVVHFDVRHVSCLSHTWDLPYLTTVTEYVRILTHHSCVALEVHSVDLVIADKSLEKPNIAQSEIFAGQKLAVG